MSSSSFVVRQSRYDLIDRDRPYQQSLQYYVLGSGPERGDGRYESRRAAQGIFA